MNRCEYVFDQIEYICAESGLFRTHAKTNKQSRRKNTEILCER